MRGAVKDAYQIRERGFDTPANRQRIGIVGGLGAVYPHPSQERKHRASVPAVPSQARNGAPCHVAATLHTFENQRGRNRVRRPCVCRPLTLPRCHGQRARARPGPQVRPQKKTLLPATVGHYEQVIYKCPRERGPICAQRDGSRAAATAGTGRGNWMGGGCAICLACRRAGDWCRGWPRAIGAGAVGHGTRGGVAACVRKS